jgi:O-glycosyl hydrolase
MRRAGAIPARRCRFEDKRLTIEAFPEFKLVAIVGGPPTSPPLSATQSTQRPLMFRTRTSILLLGLALTACASRAPPTVMVTVSPSSVALSPGGQQAFVAASTDTGAPVTWSIEEGAAGGSITQDGVYTAPAAAGQFHVVASVTSLESVAVVEVVAPPPPPQAIQVAPSAASLAPGASYPFNAITASGDHPPVTWSVEEAGGGSITSAGLYTAPTASGVFHVVATSTNDASNSASASVTVAAVPVVTVAVSPSTTSLPAGGAASFNAIVTGTANTAVVWYVQPASGGTVDSQGNYAAPLVGGTYRVVATSDADPSKSGAATISVASIVVGVTPKVATVPQRGSQGFSCTVSGAADTSCTWSVQEASGGTVTSTGVYTAPSSAGTFHVVAQSALDPAISDVAQVTVPAVAVTVTPGAAALPLGGAAAFSCSVSGTTDGACTWSVAEGAAGGSVTAGGAYTAPTTAGTYHVVATSHADPTKSATASVTVSSAAILINPATATVSPGGTQGFSCTVSGAADTSCTWSVQEASGGTVTSSGVYTAPATAGTYHVVATSHADPSKSSVATVAVPLGVSISPQTASLAAGAQQTFTCAITGSSDTTCIWTVAEGATGGGITSGGVYTAPATGGTYHVIATSDADPTKTATANVVVTQSGDIVVDFSNLQQSIDGFGAADVWVGNLTAAQADMFFCVNAGGACASGGIGLSLLRAGIDDSGNYQSGAWNNAALANARGAKVWAAPWSPTAQYKTTGNINTGSLNPGSYDAWASVLAAFPAKLKQQTGVTLYAISAQNEPDYNTNGAYPMCLYSGAQLVSFIDVLGPKLAALNPRPKLLAAETSTWGNLWPSYGSLIVADPSASGYIDIYASHQYDYTNPANPIPSGKRLWETEVSTFDGPSTDIGNGITVGKWIHGAMTVANANAWHYWWLIGLNNDNEGLINPGNVVTKRFYVLGNYSKFVRPGYVRVSTSGGPPNIYASAYRDPSSGNFAVVVINDSASDVTQRFAFNGAVPGAVTPNVTSSSLDLAGQAALDASSGSFTTTVAAQSVTTFVGTAH